MILYCADWRKQSKVSTDAVIWKECTIHSFFKLNLKFNLFPCLVYSTFNWEDKAWIDITRIWTDTAVTSPLQSKMRRSCSVLNFWTATVNGCCLQFYISDERKYISKHIKDKNIPSGNTCKVLKGCRPSSNLCLFQIDFIRFFSLAELHKTREKK